MWFKTVVFLKWVCSKNELFVSNKNVVFSLRAVFIFMFVVDIHRPNVFSVCPLYVFSKVSMYLSTEVDTAPGSLSKAAQKRLRKKQDGMLY